MRITPANKTEVFAKRAALLDEKAARARIRAERATKLGNKREAEGARRTIEDAEESARKLRALIEQ